jgi:hypothetical protein
MRDGSAEALDVLAAGIERAARPSVKRILTEDRGIVAAYLLAHAPAARADVLARFGAPLPHTPSLRFVLVWETDANDVDLHVHDARGGHAFYGERRLASGGELLDDLTDGFGPEMFVVQEPRAFPYEVAVHYYARGPEGVGLGSVQIVNHDGNGNVTIEERPFVIQNDNAVVELGSVR